MEPRSPALQADSLPSEPQGKPKNTGVGSLSFLQGIFVTQDLNQGFLHCRCNLYSWATREAPSPITSWKTEEEKVEAVTDFIFLGSKITMDSNCSHEIKRCLLLGRKAKTNLDSILKSKYITLPKKVHIVKAMVFPVVMYGYESWTIKKSEWWRIDVFKLWCWRRHLRVLWLTKTPDQSFHRKSTVNTHWKDWSWIGSSDTLVTWCEELTHWKRR